MFSTGDKVTLYSLIGVALTDSETDYAVLVVTVIVCVLAGWAVDAGQWIANSIIEERKNEPQN